MAVDTWAEASAYERYMGRWSSLVAAAFVPWLDLPAGGRWLDLACGTGALTRAVRRLASPRSVLAMDRSEGFLRHARDTGTAAAVAADAGKLPFRARAFDVVVTGLALNFLPAPGEALRALRDILEPGGTLAAYVWDYSEGMRPLRIFWDVAVALDPSAAKLDEGPRFPICRRQPLGEAFRRAGYRDVSVKAVDVPARFVDFDDYWTPFLGGQGPAPGYVASLPDTRREALRDALRRRLPAAPDGSITLQARAWAARGRG